MCSNEMTMSRNSGIFWSILQSSMFFGNSFVFWQFEGTKTAKIDYEKRQLVFSVLTGVSIIGVISMCFLRKPQ
jgi:MFS transporter, NAG-T family, sugar:H+ symporter